MCIRDSAYSGAVVSDTIARFRERYPDTPLYLQIRDSNTLRDMVVSGELDLAAVADESELEGLRGHRLASLRAVTVFPEGHPLARLEQVGLAQLAEVDVIALNAEDASRQRLDALVLQAGLSLRVAIETPYSSTVCPVSYTHLDVYKRQVQPGDVILTFNKEPIKRWSDLPRIVGETKPGTRADMEVWRKGKKMTLSVKVGEIPVSYTHLHGRHSRPGR